MTSNNIKKLTTAALLCAVGIMVPLVMPRIMIGPASYTLASHVAVMIAMFISPVTSIAVALITALGFLLSGFPQIIVLRALSHVVFVLVGALFLKKFPNTLQSKFSMVVFALFISIIHAFCEAIVVNIFAPSSLLFVVGFIGLGGFIHSLIDFSIAVLVWVPVQKFVNIPANAKIKLLAK